MDERSASNGKLGKMDWERGYASTPPTLTPPTPLHTHLQLDKLHDCVALFSGPTQAVTIFVCTWEEFGRGYHFLLSVVMCCAGGAQTVWHV